MGNHWKAVKILTIKYCKSLIIHLQLLDNLQNTQLYRLNSVEKGELIAKSDRKIFICA